MKSPFPGMDPYLESKWPEVHARLIVYATNQLNGKLPSDLHANIEENVGVYNDTEFSRSIRPDLHIAEETTMESASNVGGVNALDVAIAAKPLIVNRPLHPTRHIEIVGSDSRLVTAIEFVSPWNKVGILNRENYTRKQRDYLDSNINLVEIDLVRFAIARTRQTYIMNDIVQRVGNLFGQAFGNAKYGIVRYVQLGSHRQNVFFPNQIGIGRSSNVRGQMTRDSFIIPVSMTTRRMTRRRTD